MKSSWLWDDSCIFQPTNQASLDLKLFLAIFQFQNNKMDKKQEISVCCVYIATETCLHQKIPDQADPMSARCLDSGRTRRGGLCVYVSDAWCSVAVKVDGPCFPDVWGLNMCVLKRV